MLTPIVLVVGLLLATAYIAYWSDNLGKKLGKKRVTFMKFRPRTTATIFTILSSEVIMIFTVLVLLLIYSPLRNALFTYDKVRAENRSLQTANTSLQSERFSLEAAATQSRNRLAAEKTQVQFEVKDLGLTQGKLVSSRADLTRVRATLVVAQEGEDEARAEQAAAKKGEAAAEVRAAAARLELDSAQAGLQDVEAKYTKAAAELKSRQEELVAAKGQLQLTVSELGVLQLQLTSARAEYDSARKSAFAATARELQAEGKADAAEKLAEEVSKTAERLSADAHNVLLLAYNYPRVPVNQVLASGTVPAHSSVSDVRAILVDLISEGQTVVPTLLDGAQLDVMLAPDTAPVAPDEDGPVLDKLAASIADHDEEVSLRLVAARNYLNGEKFVDALFEGVVSREAFKAGDTIAQTQLDGRDDDAQVFSGLNRLLDLGREQAVAQNVTPPFSPASPNFYSSGTNERMFQALRDVEALKRPATVKLVAASDLSTVDPLNVRFEVE